MKKRIATVGLCCLILLSMLSCGNDSGNITLELKDSSVYEMDFGKLYKTLRKAARSEEDKNAFESLEIDFLADGEIRDFSLTFWALKRDNKGKSVLREYSIMPDRSDIKPYELFWDRAVSKLEMNSLGNVREGGAAGLDPDSFERRMNQLDSMDIKGIADTYRVGSPVWYQLRANPVEKDILMGEYANTIFLLYKADGSLERVDAPEDYEIEYMSESEIVEGIKYPDMEYFVLSPYYEKTDDSVTGSYEVTLGQTDSYMEKHTYVSTNHIVILLEQ